MQYVPVYIDDLPEVDPFPFVLFSTMNGRFFPMLDHGQAMDMAKRLQLKQNDQIWAYLAPEDFSGYLRLLYGQNTQDRHISRLRYLHDHFFPVEGVSLRVGTLFPCHLFTLNDQLEPSLILANHLRALNNQVEPELQEIYPLWIHRNDIAAYEGYLHQCWAATADEIELNLEGGILLRMNACRATYDLFRNEEVPKAIEAAKKVVQRLCLAILHNPHNYYSLLKVSDLWFNTFIHSVNVAVLSMGVGLEMALDPATLQHLGLGGLLHDIGNIYLDPNLLLSSTRFNEETRKQFQDHVTHGEAFCQRYSEIPEEVTHIVAQHHERYDGSGYSQGLRGIHLDPLGQIVGLMEIYDALTNRQPFRRAYTPFQAYGHIINMGKAIQQNLLRTAIIATGKQNRYLQAAKQVTTPPPALLTELPTL